MKCRFETASSATEPIHRLFVATKAFAVLDAMESVTDRLRTDTQVVLIQNGLGFHETVAERFPELALFCAVSTEGAWLRKPAHVVHAGQGLTRIGAWQSRNQPLLGRLCNELGRSGLDVVAELDLHQALWRKWAINCVINAMSAVHDCPNGALIEVSALHQSTIALVNETTTVLRQLGQAAQAIDLADDVRRVAIATAANRSSMHQDLAHGRRTEIDFLNGHLCRLAEQHGLSCPLHEELVREVRRRESLCGT